MAKVSVIGSLQAQPGREGEMDRVLADMVEAARHEPGVEVYSYHRGEGGRYWFFALMADEESMQNHGKTGAMAEVMARFAPLAAGPPEMTITTPLAAVGLEL